MYGQNFAMSALLPFVRERAFEIDLRTHQRTPERRACGLSGRWSAERAYAREKRPSRSRAAQLPDLRLALEGTRHGGPFTEVFFVHLGYYVQLYMRMYTTICTCTCSTSVVAGPQVLKHEGRRHRRCFRFRAPRQVQYAHSTHKWHVATAAREREGSRESADYLTAEIAHRSGGATR